MFTLSKTSADDLYLLRPGSSLSKMSNLIFSLASSSVYLVPLTTVDFLTTPGINGFPFANKFANEFLKS